MKTSYKNDLYLKTELSGKESQETLYKVDGQPEVPKTTLRSTKNLSTNGYTLHENRKSKVP